MPINKVEKHTVGDGLVGPVTKKLHTFFDQLVKNECGENK